MPDTAREIQFDGIVGPTHNYSALAVGNLASQRHGGKASNPKAAALEGLEKMRCCMDLGLPQAVLPPQERPAVAFLRQLGFSGSDTRVLERAANEAPMLLAAASSASSMWAANAATVSPSADTDDGRVHFTPANLLHNLHRSIEADQTARTLRALFADPRHFAVHDPLPASPSLSDEGAANHSRFCTAHSRPGIELFTFGNDAALRSATGSALGSEPSRFMGRQSRLASETIARRHGVREAMFIQQHPAAIDAGVFHNDVIAVGHRDVLFYHEHAFGDGDATIDRLAQRFEAITNQPLRTVKVLNREVSIDDAVSSYLFNSQLVTPQGSNRMVLICPTQCMEIESARAFLGRIKAASGPIADIHPVDVRQSMQNGGGPACLRLRVVLTDQEQAAMHQGVRLNDTLLTKLIAWVNRHYRDRLEPKDLADPNLLLESRVALDELTGLLGLGSIYRFQT